MKYKNIHQEYCGYSFASKLEASVFKIYKLRERAGELKIVRTQSKVPLPGGIYYIADFELNDLNTGEIFFGEAKGLNTSLWRLKLKLFREFQNRKLEIWTGSYIKPVLSEVVIPKPNKTCPHCGRPC